MSSNIELKAADTMLEKGVKVYFRAPFFFRLFLNRIGITIPDPSAATIIKISSYYLSMGVTPKALAALEFDSLMQKQVDHTRTLAKLVACAILNNRLLQNLFTGVLAWWLLGNVKQKQLCRITEILVIQGGIEDFTNTIGLGEKLNMMTPKTSPTSPTS